ncbi:hypothetical protein F9288_09845 [Sphingomonas sp. CL5.1]|nr:hypothetical protein [Sphingomonas sp. CL5.1]QKR99905.1 hypothetical protein F9288_09845 [Sphingomonas sp. CL5.1]
MFLASDAAASVTGAHLPVDGGLMVDPRLSNKTTADRMPTKHRPPSRRG